MFGKLAKKAVGRVFDRLSRCPGCKHTAAAARCRCRRSDCACGTPHNR